MARFEFQIPLRVSAVIAKSDADALAECMRQNRLDFRRNVSRVTVQQMEGMPSIWECVAWIDVVEILKCHIHEGASIAPTA